MGALNADRWQRRLDSLFPQGAVVTWLRGGGGSNTTYQVAYMKVTGMASLDPLVTMYVSGASKVLEDMRLTGWDVIRTKPHLLVKATVVGSRAPLLLCAEVPAPLAAVMAPQRQALIQPEAA